MFRKETRRATERTAPRATSRRGPLSDVQVTPRDTPSYSTHAAVAMATPSPAPVTVSDKSDLSE